MSLVTRKLLAISPATLVAGTVATVAFATTQFEGVALAQHSVTIHLAGDSTMAPKVETRRPETGWGEALAALLDPRRLAIDNRAKNGRSTTSFLAEGRWQELLDVTQPGDWVFIQFGHNDEKEESPARYASPADYGRNLRRFVAEVRARKATPVLLTPIVRRRFDEKGRLYDTHGAYPDIVRAAAAELDVDLIDLHALTRELLVSSGEEASRELFLILEPGEHPNYPEGNDDNTHLSPVGAKKVAELALEPFREILAKHRGTRAR